MVCFKETLTNKAFSLIEMMVVVCIVAVTATFAMPAIDSFMASQRVAAEAESFVAGVRLARYKALQESTLHRLIFDLDAANYVNAYKIEACTKYDDDVYGDISEDSSGLVVDFAYDSLDWESILEMANRIRIRTCTIDATFRTPWDEERSITRSAEERYQETAGGFAS